MGTSRELALGVTFVVAAGLVGALAAVNSMLAMSAVALTLFGIWAATHPYPAACTLAFLTAAFPKAGVKVFDFPVPVFLLGLVVSVVFVGVHRRRVAHDLSTVLLLWLLFGLLAVRVVLFTEAGPSAVFAFLGWAAVPVAILVLATRIEGDVSGYQRAFQWGFLFAVAYGFVQFFGGIEAIAVPGLTYTLGDDLTSKNNTVYAQTVPDFSKIPSTYQNGNIFGAVAALFFVIAVQRLMKRQATRLDILTLVGAVAAIAMSGSRTAIVASAVPTTLLLFRSGQVGRKLAVFAVVATAGGATLALQPGLRERYSLDNILSTGGAGRQQMWESTLQEMTVGDFIIGTPTYRLSEGWLGLVLQVGLVGIAVILAVLLRVTRRRRDWRVPLLVLAVSAVLDASFQLFPVWFIPAAMMVACVARPSDMSCYGDSPLQRRVVRATVP